MAEQLGARPWRARITSPWTLTLIAFGVSQAIILAGSIIRIPIITTALGEAGYGTFATITSIWPAVQILASGLASTGRVVVAEKAERLPATVTVLRRTGLHQGSVLLLVGAVLLPILGPTVGWGFAWSVLWVGVASAIALPIASHEGILEGSGRTALAHLALSATTIIGLPVLILALGLRQDLVTVVAASLVGFVAPYFTCWLLVRWLVKVPEGSPDAGPVRLGRLSAAMTGWSLSNMLVFIFDPVILFTTLGPEATAQYHLATRITGLVTVVPVALTGMLTVWFSRARTQPGGASVHARLAASTALFFVAGIVLAVFCILVGPALGDLLSRGAISTPSELYVWMGVYGGLTCATAPLVAAWEAPSGAGLRARIGISLGVINVALSIALALVLGVAGPVIATVICNMVIVSVLAILAWTKPHLISGTGASA